MLCFPCYVFSFKLLLNHLELNFYDVLEVEALVPSMDSKLLNFPLQHYFALLKAVV